MLASCHKAHKYRDQNEENPKQLVYKTKTHKKRPNTKSFLKGRKKRWGRGRGVEKGEERGGGKGEGGGGEIKCYLVELKREAGKKNTIK